LLETFDESGDGRDVYAGRVHSQSHHGVPAGCWPGISIFTTKNSRCAENLDAGLQALLYSIPARGVYVGTIRSKMHRFVAIGVTSSGYWVPQWPCLKDQFISKHHGQTDSARSAWCQAIRRYDHEGLKVASKAMFPGSATSSTSNTSPRALSPESISAR